MSGQINFEMTLGAPTLNAAAFRMEAVIANIPVVLGFRRRRQKRSYDAVRPDRVRKVAESTPWDDVAAHLRLVREFVTLRDSEMDYRPIGRY